MSDCSLGLESRVKRVKGPTELTDGAGLGAWGARARAMQLNQLNLKVVVSHMASSYQNRDGKMSFHSGIHLEQSCAELVPDESFRVHEVFSTSAETTA
jgi:hypothetical protein